MKDPLLSWRQLEALRNSLVEHRRVSRAEASRRAGISESTFSKGIAKNAVPTNSTRKAVLQVLREFGVQA